ncbi:VanZ family protein [Rubripirellula sp.]|nr:VanZ family protein [Rubripirellula sp.]
MNGNNSFFPIRVRQVLAWAALLSLAALFYGSCLPLRFNPVGLEQVVSEFHKIQWYSLGVNKRADWFANGLMVLPLGFFATGALHYGRRNLAIMALTTAGLIVSLTILICLIEAIQVYFPPRVQSLNDMAAGFAGGLLGFTLWHLTGRLSVSALQKFLDLPKGIERIHFLANLSFLAIAISSLLPLDLILSFEELLGKYHEGKIHLLPLSDLENLKSIGWALLHGCWILPLSFIWTLRLGHKQAIKRIVTAAVFVELLTLPIYGRSTSVSDIAIPLILGLSMSAATFKFAELTQKFDRPDLLLAATIIWSVSLIAIFDIRYERFSIDEKVIKQRIENAFYSAPYASAQRSTEFQMIENIGGKLILFGLGGFLFRLFLLRLRGNSPTSRLGFDRIMTVLVVAGLSSLIEISQIFLLPLIPEISDVITGSLGAMMGIAICETLTK